MLEIYKKNRVVKPMTDEEIKELSEPKDIIVTKHQEQVTYNKDGSKTIKRIPKKINITKKINETAKLIKETTAEQKLKELERIFTK